MNKQKSIFNLVVLLNLFSIIASAQQVSDPSDNRPVQETNSPIPVDYPGLKNITEGTKFNSIISQTADQPINSWPTWSFYYRQNTSYFDGLGRPLQEIEKNGHADGYDVVKHHVFDEANKESYQYLPFIVPSALSNGKIKLNAKNNFKGFYDQAGPDEEPYALTKFDQSPLDRVTQNSPPGRNWVGQDRGTGFTYGTNSNWIINQGGQNLTVIGGFPRWTIDPISGALPKWQGDYPLNELALTITTDDDGKSTLEYRDKEDRLVIKAQGLTKKIFSSTQPSDYAYTCYVYDDLGKLRCIIPPMACKILGVGVSGGYSFSWDLSQEALDELCFQYFYDEQARLVEKKIPGKAVEEFVYDKRDRLVFTRDGNLRAQGKVQFTFYDALDRPTVTGLADASVDRLSLVNYVEDNTTYPSTDFLYYIKNYDLYHTYPTYIAGCKILTYTYYDDYDQLGGFAYDYSQFDNNLPGLTQPYLSVPSQTASTMTNGLVTGSRVRIMDQENPTTDYWIDKVNYYDDKGRVVQTQETNQKGAVDISSNIYYFQGNLWRSILKHSNPYAEPVPGAADGAINEFKLVKTFHRNIRDGGGNDQVWLITQKINNGPVYNLASYDYDHLERVTVKDLNAALVLQEYNIRGFLTHIDAEDHGSVPYKPLFEENISYDKGFKSKLYNGNIAGITWSGSDDVKNAYGYSYDDLDRLTHAEYRVFESGNWIKDNKDYTVSEIAYDLNGNIQKMIQRGNSPLTLQPVTIDDLTYNYLPNSNKLDRVEDAAAEISQLPDFKNGASETEEYTYDPNGNMLKDGNRKISEVTYNHLDKPEKITVVDKGTIFYTYDAAGNRLKKKVVEGATTTTYDYIGNFVYKNNVLQYILNEEGRARPIADASTQNYTRFIYDYFIKDHLGNVRSTVTANPINSNYLARHEIATANLEQLVFDNIPNVRDGKPGSTDPNDGMAAHLIAADADKRVGTAIMLKVMPGDKFTISANSFYEGEYQKGETVDGNQVIESLMGVLMGGSTYAGVPISELPDNIRTVQQTLTNPALADQLNQLQEQNVNPNAPKAHLNYLFFNSKMELVPEVSGAIQVPTANTGGWQSIGTTVSNISPAIPGGFQGYFILYIDNQSLGKDVWFDDVHIEHYTSSVLEEDHYYPFGLTLQTASSGGNITAQPQKYNSKELEKSFGLEMYDYGARMYNSQIGRWHGLDEAAESYEDQSPYNFVGNNPVRRVDVDGRHWGDRVAGEAVAMLDNFTGINLRNSYSPSDVKDYQVGQFWGDVNSMIGATIEGGTGGGIARTGVVVTAVSGGLAAEVSVPATVLGTAMVVHSGMTMTRAMDNLKNGSSAGKPAQGKKLAKSSDHGNSKLSKKESGHYHNVHESGKTYDGVGNEKRMNASAKRVAKKYNDPVKSQKHVKTKNREEAYIREHEGIQQNGGAGNTERNYNKINSPGKKIVEERAKAAQ